MHTVYDKDSLLNEISERRNIVQNYRHTGLLDRNKAMKTILELRSKDVDVAEVTMAKLAVSSVPFDHATDQEIISELQMQIDVLTSKLLK